MRNRLFMTGFAAALTVSVVSALSTSEASQSTDLGQPTANQSSDILKSGQDYPPILGQTSQVSSHSHPKGQLQVQPSSPATAVPSPSSEAIKLGETQPQISSADSAASADTAIAKIHTYQKSGRSAVTLYVRNIPIVTFLGSGSNPGPEVKVASTKSNLSSVTNRQGDADTQDPVWRATTVAAKINQLHQAGVNPDAIRVIWDAQRKTYVIRIKNDPLLELGKHTVLPQTTRDAGKDALQITNRLRRQLGNAAPLTDIPGRPKPTQTVAVGPIRFQITGEASWYGPGFNGAYTASGERFNQYALTAAHKTLPFGTQVRVTNLYNGRAVVVRINDRGPFVPGRVIDLSQGAAQILGVTSSGVAPVRLDVLP